MVHRPSGSVGNLRVQPTVIARHIMTKECSSNKWTKNCWCRLKKNRLKHSDLVFLAIWLLRFLLMIYFLPVTTLWVWAKPNDGRSRPPAVAMTWIDNVYTREGRCIWEDKSPSFAMEKLYLLSIIHTVTWLHRPFVTINIFTINIHIKIARASTRLPRQTISTSSRIYLTHQSPSP